MGFALSDMKVTSSAFQDRGNIPTKHSGEGENVSPPLAWSGAPEGTKAYAVICHDPDAPMPFGFTHWLLYGLAPDVTSIPEQGAGRLSAREGRNDFGETGYTGPMPPNGHGLHHYFFWVVALNQELKLQPGLNLYELLAAIEPHAVGMNRIVGTYQRA